MLLSLFIQSAWPCAGIFHDVDALAESDHQEVIIAQHDEHVAVSYRTLYDGDAENFGWVIPIFGEFISLEDGDDDRFDSLREHTQPLVERIYNTGSDDAGGCIGRSRTTKGSDNAWMDTGDLSSGGLDTVAEGFTGTYQYTVLEATADGPLINWLEENGWSIGNTSDTIAEYVAEGGVQFVAISLSDMGGQTPIAGRNLPPVDVQYAGDSLRFPSQMANGAMLEMIGTTVYVLGNERARVRGWSSQTRDQINGSTLDDPSVLYDELLWEIGGNTHAYLEVFSGENPLNSSDASRVTRFDTLASPDAHTLDPTFSLDGGMDNVDTWIVLEEESGNQSWIWFPAFGILGLGLARRRK